MLPTWNGRVFFLEDEATNAPNLSLYTDASGTHGCRTYFQGAWIHYSWEPHLQLSITTSIPWKHLFAIMAAALTWGNQWTRKGIRFYCDNQAIVHVWDGKSTKQPKLMTRMRLLFPTAAMNSYKT